jgi:hypothetical protein
MLVNRRSEAAILSAPYDRLSHLEADTNKGGCDEEWSKAWRVKSRWLRAVLN